MNPQLSSNLKRLRLSGILATLQLRVQEATANQLSSLEFLEIVLQDEITLRDDRAFAKRLKAARFRDPKTLEDFDFSFNPSLKRKQILELSTGHFIRQHQDALFIGPPGVGKSHLAQALGRQAVKMGFSVLYLSIFDAVSDLMQAEAFNETPARLKRCLAPDLLIIDDMGLKRLPSFDRFYPISQELLSDLENSINKIPANSIDAIDKRINACVCVSFDSRIFFPFFVRA